jgi:GPH family glycoside/pentoside/hexuronide:cation symporter
MRKFGMIDKIGYAFGDFGNDMFFITVSAFLMLFYTDVYGISPAVVGTIFLVTRLYDAFFDVIWGRFIDSRPTTKQGKFRPWVLRMFVPLLVFDVLVFTYIPSLTNNMSIVYCFVTYMLWATFYSTVNIPYGSAASVITQDPVERASLSTFRSVGAAFAGAIVSFLVPLLVFVNGKASASRFLYMAIAFAAVAGVAYLLFYFMTIERVQAPVGTKQKLDLKITAKGLIKNRPFLAIVVIFLLLLLASLFGMGMNSYLFKDYFHNTKALSLASLVSMVGTLVLAPFVTPLVKRFGKKEVSAVGILLSVIIYFIMYLMPTHNAYLFVLLMFLANLGFGLFNLVSWAFITDAIDYQEILTKTREDGTIYAFFSFARKVGQALAGGLTGYALAAIGYVAQKAGEPPVTQTVQVANGIKAIATLIPALVYLAVFLCLQFWYPLTKSKLTEVQQQLKEIRAAKAEE